MVSQAYGSEHMDEALSTACNGVALRQASVSTRRAAQPEAAAPRSVRSEAQTVGAAIAAVKFSPGDMFSLVLCLVYLFIGCVYIVLAR